MELIDNAYIPDKEIPRSRRVAGRKALRQTFSDLFTERNPFLKFLDAYRFNVIRWSASNLREPSWRKRIGLLFQTKNPLSILRDNYRTNRNDLTDKWEKATLNRIQMELGRMGGTPLQSKDRNILKTLKGIEKKIKRLQGYDGCPDTHHEKQLLATYRYILSSPYEKRFGKLNPDDIREMLQQNGLSASNLPYQNYEGILQGRETALYELATRQDGDKYLCPADHVKLNLATEGSSMELISRFPRKETPAVSNTAEMIQASEKKQKIPVSKESKKQQEPKKQPRSRKGKASGVKIK